MRHYIQVDWKRPGGRRERTLINLTRVVSVVDDPGGCKIHMQGYCLEVANTFDEVMDLISAADRPSSAAKRTPPTTGG